jgi:hexulose-6-phosphate isomerase
MKRLGIVQGRLSPPINNRLQAFPAGYWRDEFSLCKNLGIDSIEWIFEYANVSNNPLCSDSGIREMLKYSEDNGVRINSVLADYFMLHKLFGEDKNAVKKSIDMLFFLIGQCSKCRIPIIEIPFVDASALKTAEIKEEVRDNLKKLLEFAREKGIAISLETSLPPGEFRDYIDAYKPQEVYVNYDMGNSASLGYDAEEEIGLYGDKIINIHIKDRIRYGGTVPLCQGNTDFHSVFSALKKTGYKGDFILQAARQDLPENSSGKTFVEAVEEYIEFIRPFMENFQ